MKDDSIQLVKSLYEAFTRGDLNAIYDRCDPLIQWTSNADPVLLPWGGERKGVDGVRSFFADLFANVEFREFEPHQFLGGPDLVIVLGRSVARAKASGGRIEDEWAHLLWLRNGRVVRFREFADTHAIVLGYQGAALHVARRDGAETDPAHPH